MARFPPSPRNCHSFPVRRFSSRSFPVIVTLVFLAGCNGPRQERTPTLGTAWAGPATLSLHRDLDPKSPVEGIVHHGDKLEIIGQRRRSWYRVRTAKGIEGWTSNRELLDSGQMERLKALSAETAGAPSQGIAATFGTLNVHSEPNRQSTSFVQLSEHEKFDVIAHKVVARAPPPKRELIPEKPKVVKKAGKKTEKTKKAPAIAPPPAPPAPLPPPDWVALSGGQDRDEAAASSNPGEAHDLTPAVSDDWTLIRTHAGQSGWVLTSAIYLQVPDEVAQYAEGHRITSYFSIGKVADGAEQKDVWLWTTSEKLGEDHDFDSFRVFSWSLRHHRYETAYIQRRERGYFPVLAKSGEFSVCLEVAGGGRVRKRFAMTGNSVKKTGETACAKTAEAEEPVQDLAVAEESAPAAQPGLIDRLKARFTGLFGRSH